MNDKTIIKICTILTIAGIIFTAIFYEDEYPNTTISQIKNGTISKGIIKGQVEYVITNYPTTIFVLNDGNKATIYYPKPTTLEKKQIIIVYAENEKESKNKMLLAHKVVEYE